MPKRVLILGASRYHVRAICAAREIGCETIVVDRNAKAEGFEYADHFEVIDFSDAERTMQVSHEYDIDGVIPLNDYGVPTAAAVAAELDLPGISPEAAIYATSKAWMRQRWAEAGVPSAQYRIARSVEETRIAASEIDSWPLVVKPVDSRGGGSRGVSVVEGPADIGKAVTFAQQYCTDNAIIIEEYLQGLEHSIETITYEGKIHVLAIADKEKTPLPYRVDKSVIYPTIATGKERKRIAEVAKAAVKALDIEIGPAHVEMCTTDDGPRLFELGARCGGGGTPDPILPFLTGVNMFQEVVRIAIGEEPKRLLPRYRKGCVYRFLTPPPGIVSHVSGLETLLDWDGILDCYVPLRAGDKIPQVKTGANRSGFIIAGGETRQEAVNLADRVIRHINIEYENRATFR